MILRIKDLCFSYGERKIIENYSLNLEAGERICLSAASGKGKTTLLRLIAGLEKPLSGIIEVSGRIAYLFQEDRLLEWHTALENVILAGADRNEALAALKAVGLGDAADKRPAELSGGMKRRAAIARALCFGGDLLLLDEPFGGIDAERRELTARAVERYFARAAIVLITHDPAEADLLGARIIETEFLQ